MKNWDYSSCGEYFITICTKNREKFFGEVVGGKMQLTEIGRIAHRCWREIPKHFPNIILDEFIIMPNHVHGIICIIDDSGIDFNNAVETHHDACVIGNNGCRDAINRVSTECGGVTGNKNPMLYLRSLSKIVRWFKGRATFEINEMQGKLYFQWQPRFHDRIIRNQKELDNIREYIVKNPLKWEFDRNNAQNLEN